MNSNSCSKGVFTQNRYFLTAVTLLNIRKDVIKTVHVHSGDLTHLSTPNERN